MRKPNHTLRPRLCAALLALLIALPALGAAAAETYAVVEGTQSLNLRAGASVSSQWLGAYPSGTWVTVTGSQNNFYAVTTADGKFGYMSKNFLSTTDQLTYGDVAIVQNQKPTAFLNFRAYPSYTSAVLGILYNGVPLTVLEETGGWYRVMLGNIIGYVRGEYITISHQPTGIAVATIKTPNNASVNMRAAPSAGAAVVRQFAGDRYVSVLSRGNGWWYVCIDRYVGFISTDFLAEGLKAARDNAAPVGDDEPYAVVCNPVSKQKLNLRSLPSATATIIARLGNGYRLSVVAQGTEWCKVFADTYAATGYVQTRYLTLSNLPATPKLTITHPQGAAVTMRSAASISASVVSKLPNGAQAVVLVPGPEWTQVRYGGKTGYVLNYFTTMANP